ncbi:fungal-specific transcription factor domain-containing protein [Bisporella sp. PMI_857]|nr:fungal-specific transcription factor domain-containing protein [Bisporella sp. PMI_857]
MEQNHSPLVVEEASRKPKRSGIACERCHKNKTKCDGETPCRNCQQSRKRMPCVYPVRDKKIPVPESYIKTLEAENQALKRKQSLDISQQSELSDASSLNRRPGSGMSYQSSHSSPSDRNKRQRVPAHSGQTFNGIPDASANSGANFVSDEISIQPRYSGEASSETFGGRLHQYINHGERRPPPRAYVYYKNPRLLRISSTECNLPNKNYAKLLVRAVLRFVGGDHHLLSRKSFLVKLEETYQQEVLDDPVWLCRLFTVLALGELYSHGRAGGTLKGAGVPGTGFFVKAMGFFQDMHEEPSVSYIETLLLLSFYSVALNRRNTAYTYTGLAMRLSLTLGLHRRISEDSGMSAPEREHRVRVWWTCYALDRIYTSKVGLPIMLRDEDIDVQMPSMDGLTLAEAEDFYTPELMTAQINLARITGNIMSDLYKIPQQGRANTFVQSVQRILTSLRSWHETLPPVLRLDFSAMPIYPSRSVASLHLHFGNAVIQTTRPILFHLFRSQFAQDSDNPRAQVSPMTSALGEACVQAARTSNSILAQLWVDGCLAPYGYFDALSVFASTMILMMSSTMKEDDNNDNDAVETAWSLLRSMRETGNLPASGYYDQLVELKLDLDSLKQNSGEHQSSQPTTKGNNGLEMLLAASSSVHQGEQAHSNGATQTPASSGTAFGVGDAMGALDDPFLQDFLQQPYGNWNPDSFDPVSGMPSTQFQFDWENANLYGNLGSQ